MNHRDDLYAEALRARRSVRVWRWVLAGLAVVLVASGTAFAFTGPLAPADDDRPPAGTTGTATPGASTTVVADASAPAGCRNPLDPENPLRLWIGGDSLAGSLGPSLGELTGATGVVQPTFHSKVSSGLASEDFYDWPAHAPEDFLKYDPEVAVFFIGTNDAKGLAQNAGDNPRWRMEYTLLVEEMLEVLIGEGRTVYWVGAPVMKDRAFSVRAQAVNAIFEEVIAQYPTAHYVDAYSVLSDSEGKYASSLPDADGDSVLVRAGDGVHLTPEGGDLVANAVFEQLDPECDIEQQAVPGQAKKTVEVRGSSQLPGTRRTTTATAPATTVPATVATTLPATTLPVTTTAPATSVPTATTVKPPTPPTGPTIRAPGAPPTAPQ
jgi:hypothetical protein